MVSLNETNVLCFLRNVSNINKLQQSLKKWKDLSFSCCSYINNFWKQHQVNFGKSAAEESTDCADEQPDTSLWCLRKQDHKPDCRKQEPFKAKPGTEHTKPEAGGWEEKPDRTSTNHGGYAGWVQRQSSSVEHWCLLSQRK